MRQSVAFSPVVQITPVGDRIAVLFDSASSEDENRTSRATFIPRLVSGLSWNIEAQESGSYQLKLLASLDDGDKEFDMGNIDVPGLSLRDARQALANAFQHALTVFLSASRPRGDASLPSPVQASTEVAPENGRAYAATRRLAIRAFAMPLLLCAIVVLGLFIGQHFLPGPSNGSAPDSIHEAVAQNMAQDPAAITAQVELTKETLRQMGLDPGRAGDLGCLAAQ